MKIVFFGSSDFSLHALEACIDSGCEVALAVTTPDRKKGRGLQLAPTPVKMACQQRGIAVLAPEKLGEPQAIDPVRRAAPDLFVVSSYGKFLPSSYLKIPATASLNVHPSLLPRYRGAAPINWPIINGDEETGVTIMEVTNKLDSGDIFFQARVPISARSDSAGLAKDLGRVSYDALRRVIDLAANGELKRAPQDEALATYARKLKKEDGRISFDRPAGELDRLIRGLQPWPGVYMEAGGITLAILKAEPVSDVRREKPGTLLGIGKDGSVEIATGQGLLRIHLLKPAGKKEMTAAEFVRGRRWTPGSVFG